MTIANKLDWLVIIQRFVIMRGPGLEGDKYKESSAKLANLEFYGASGSQSLLQKWKQETKYTFRPRSHS